MRLNVRWMAAAVLGVAGLARGADVPMEKPNIVVIVADDLGWNAVGYHHGYARTPHVDSIAKEGVELDRFYVSPMCSPTREGIMTGRYPIRYGLGRSVIRPWAMAGLPPEELTIAEAMKQAGYEDRAAFGKWHMGHLDVKWHPLNQGFTHFEGCYNGAEDYFTRDRDGQMDWHVNYDDVKKDGYSTDIIADIATKYVQDHSKTGKPFFCYVAFTAVHEPAQATQQYIDQYPKLKGEKKILAAQDTCMDDGIGKILDAIKDGGIQKKTIVWFLSDNGGIRKIPGNNLPLKGGKLECYEGGIRTPAAVWWPGVIEGGRKLESPVVNVDLLPTLAHVAGAKIDWPNPLDGVDVLDALTGKEKEAPQRDVYSFTGQQGIEKEQLSVLSDGWKLVVTGPDIRREGGVAGPGHKVELYHLADDLNEKEDVAEKEPAKVKELGEKLVSFRKSEPAGALEPTNEKPAGFVIPKNWHNGPKE